MRLVHPRERKLNKPADALLKIADILYFYETGEVDRARAKKQLIFLKLITKKTFPKDYEDIWREIEYALELLEKRSKPYSDYIKRLEQKYSELMKGFRTLDEFFGS